MSTSCVCPNPSYVIVQTGKVGVSHADCHAKVVHLERVWNPALERQAGWKPSSDLFGYPDCPGSKTQFELVMFCVFSIPFFVWCDLESRVITTRIICLW